MRTKGETAVHHDCRCAGDMVVRMPEVPAKAGQYLFPSAKLTLTDLWFVHKVRVRVRVRGCCYIYSNQTITYQQILGGVGVSDALQSRCSEIESFSCHLEFFFLKKWTDLDFYEQKFQETEKFNVRKVKCLVRATERKMSVWRMETSDDLTKNKDRCL